MSTSAIGSLTSSYLEQVLASALQSAGNTSSTSGASSSLSDSSQLSPFAQLVSTLQQLRQSDPAEYKKVTQQIAANLQSAAQTAQSEGNAGAASQLNQLATDFTNASQSGQLLNLQDLAQAVGGGGGGHHHHHAQVASSDSSTATSSSSSTSSTVSITGSGSSTSQSLSQLLAALSQTGASQSGQNTSLDAGAIILQTLASAGIGTSNS